MPEQRPSPTSFSANLQFNMGGHIDEIPVQKLARINSQWGFGGVISPVSLQFVCLYVSTLIVMQCLIKTEDIYIALLNTVIHLLYWFQIHGETVVIPRIILIVICNYLVYFYLVWYFLNFRFC